LEDPNPNSAKIRKLTTISRKAVDTPDYENHAPLIEVVAVFALPKGKTRPLRCLVDSGATNNFIHSNLIKEFKLETTALEDEIILGSAENKAQAEGETKPLTMEIGHHCKHRSVYTVLDLGDYDVILGRPFQNYSGARIDPNECQVPTRRGWQKLPSWAASPSKKVKLIRL
jgi:hypothetical protein